MMRKQLRVSLLSYARELRDAQQNYHLILSNYGHGLEIVFDGLVEWSLNVKVRKTGTLFGVETKERHKIFCRSIRTHVVSSSLAQHILKPGGDSWLPIEEDDIIYNEHIYGPDQVSWPHSIFDWREDDGDSPEFLQTDTSSESLKLMVAADEDAVLLSRSIDGFEGKEDVLASIRRRKEAFRDGSVWQEDALLVGIELRGEVHVLFDDELIIGEDRRWLLRNASRLFPSY